MNFISLLIGIPGIILVLLAVCGKLNNAESHAQNGKA